MNLTKKLAAWVAHGLITHEQAKAIETHEESLTGKNWVVYGVAGIGITAFITGIISVVAANWDAISPTVKLGFYFFVQAALGIAFFRAHFREGLYRETVATLFSFVVLSGIALVGQIFHLHSEGWQAILFWLALIFPATLLTHSRLLNHCWCIGLGAAMTIWLNATRFEDSSEQRLLVAVGVAYVFLGIGFWRHPQFQFSTYFRRACATWSVIALLAVITPFTNVMYGEHFVSSLPTVAPLVLVWFACGLTSAMIFLSQPTYGRLLVRCLVALLIALCAYLTFPMLFNVAPNKVLGCLGFMTIWALAAAAAALDRHRRWFDIATVVIALRFIFVYFEVFGSLAASGIGLMISGVVILVVAFSWHRFRRPLARWLEEHG